MTKEEQLINECFISGINILKCTLPINIKGLYFSDNETEPIIVVDKQIQTQAESCCILAEELGHYYTSQGNLLTDSSLDSTVVRQQETRAKRWAFRKLISIDKFIEACENGIRNRFELAEYIGVTEDFLEQTLKFYRDKYGLYKIYGNYIIYFEPLGILKMLE